MGHSKKINEYNNGLLADSNELVIEIVRPKSDLSVWHKICFGIAGLPFQMYFCVISTFVNVFLLNKAQLTPDKVLYVLFISRLIDAITDPIYGYFVNNTKSTKYGKMKPWIMISLPLSMVSYVMMWYIPVGWSKDQLFIWFITWHSIFFTVLTGVRIPHTSMTMYISKNQEDRQSATIYRMGFELIGLLLALAIQGPFALSESGDCSKTNTTTTTPISTSTSSNSTISVEVKNSSDDFFGPQKYAILAIVISIFFAVGNMLLIIFVDEKDDINTEKDSINKSQDSTLTELKRMFTFRPFIILAISFVCNQLTVQILQANLQIYFDYGYYKIKDHFINAIGALLVLAILFVPLWQFVMNRFGKKISLVLGNTLLIPLMIGSLIFKKDDLSEVIPFYIFLVIAANSFTVSFLVPWAMLPECFDAYYLEFKSRPDALFYTFFILGVKILMAFWFGFTQAILAIVNFENNVCAQDQNPNVQQAVILLMAPVPFVLSLISSLALYFYPINEKVACENTIKITRLKENQEKQNSIQYEKSNNEESEVYL